MNFLKCIAFTGISSLTALQASANGQSQTVRLGIIGTGNGNGNYTTSAISLSVAVGAVTGGAIMGTSTSVATFTIAGGQTLMPVGTDPGLPFETNVFGVID